MRKWISLWIGLSVGVAQAADLPTLLRAAVQTHPDMAAAQAAIEAAQRQKDAVAAALNPQVNLALEQDYAWMKTDFARSSLQLRGSWTLWQPQKDEEVRAASADIVQRQAQQAAVRQKLLWQVVDTWVDWQRLQRTIQFERERQRVLTQLLDQIRENYGAGKGVLAKVALLARRKAESQARLRQLTWRAEQARARLRALTGHDDLNVVQAPPLPIIGEAQQPPIDWQRNPRMRALSEAIKALSAQQRAQKGRYQGKVSVFATGVRNDSGGRFYDDMEGVRVGVRYDVPLWSGGNIEAQADRLVARQRALRAEQAALRRQLKQLWDQAQAVLEQAPQREAALLDALKASRMDEEANLALLRSGEVSVLTVLESALARYQLQRDRDLNRWAAWRAKWQQRYATGDLSADITHD